MLVFILQLLDCNFLQDTNTLILHESSQSADQNIIFMEQASIAGQQIFCTNWYNLSTKNEGMFFNHGEEYWGSLEKAFGLVLPLSRYYRRPTVLECQKEVIIILLDNKWHCCGFIQNRWDQFDQSMF